MYKLLGGDTKIMYITKKDLILYKDRYKYHFKLLDTLIRYSLTLIKQNINDNDLIINVFLDVRKILKLLDFSIISDKNMWDFEFKPNEKHVLINDSIHSQKIKEYYEILVKLAKQI